MRGNTWRPSGQWMTPRATTRCAARPPTGCPSSRILAARGSRIREIARSVSVLFPAPFDPSTATISPVCTRRDTARRAWIRP